MTLVVLEEDLEVGIRYDLPREEGLHRMIRKTDAFEAC
jgi:hypothetical protein